MVPFSSKKHRAGLGSRRLSGRPALNASPSSFSSATNLDSASDHTTTDIPRSRPGHRQHANQILSQVKEWLHHEKARASKRKTNPHAGHAAHASATGLLESLVEHVHKATSGPHQGHHDRSSANSEESLALQELEKILSSKLQLDEDNESITRSRKTSIGKRKGSIRRATRKRSTGVSSDTDHYQDGDVIVPSTEVILDNSKTLSYSGGAALSQLNLSDPSKKGKKEAEAWVQFKNEIVRLTHTLKCKGWRRVPLDWGAEIDVERLSGALTNAVYVVSPPRNLSHLQPSAQESTTSLVSKRPPAKLLLRIYGPQVEHLIDRDKELQILRRLARKRIGPRLLGTFSNGRFEQFFEARTLTAQDLRIPETSKQIARRMRELHEGIELLEEERNAGPFMWQNWDKWVARCEEVISWIDEKMIAGKQGAAGTGADAMKMHGLVCGVEWSVFRKAVDRYRKWLESQYGGSEGIKEELVFAHNDTQYGNLLRLQPSGESPLLYPANEHKQLVVIDFEYASANVPGQEFANHFTEWCYNYHNAAKSYALNERWYPTPEEQHRFVKAYVEHQSLRPSLSTQTSSTSLRPVLSQSFSSFNLDSRTPPAQITEEMKVREEAVEHEVQRLINEARIWRPANSAQWVAWGIVQAKVPGMDEALEAKKSSAGAATGNVEGASDPSASPQTEEKNAEVEVSGEDESGEDEFDYLAYARERAMFFWGDLLQMELAKEEELPEQLRTRVKVVEY
ncbi:MAG: hypothetical protein Q9173_001996 [Seirophora scorigena]